MLGRRVRRVLKRRPVAPAVSVVVTVGPRQGRHLAGCLESLRSQGRPPAEILLAQWGGAGLDERALDHEVSLLPPSPTANDARNRGADAATADAVLFIEATETLLPRALGALAETFASEGAEVVADASGSLAGRLWGTDSMPAFDPRHGRFPHAALQRAEGTKVPGRLVHHTDRSWSTAFNQHPPAAAELSHLTALLRDLVDERLVTGVLTDEVSPFLDDLEHATPAHRDAFAGVLGQVLERLSSEALLNVPVHTRICCWLVAEGRHEQMWRAMAEELRPRGHWPTVASGGRILADHSIPGHPWSGFPIPDRIREIRPEPTASLRTLRRDGDRLRIGLYAGLRWLDSRAHPPHLVARLVHQETGARRDLEVTPRPDDHGSDRFFAQRHQDHTNSSFELAVDVAALGGGRWHLELDISAAGINVSGRVHDVNRRSSAGLLDAGSRARAVMDRTGFHLVAGEPSSPPVPAPGTPVLTHVTAGETLLLKGRSAHPLSLELVHSEWRHPVEVSWDEGAFSAEVSLRHDPWGIGVTALPTGTWHLRWSSEHDGGDLALPPGLAAATPWDHLTADHRITVLRGVRGQLVIELAPPLREQERSVGAQSRMRSAYLESTEPVDPQEALFWSYAGTGATDSPRVIFEELRRRRPGVRCRWMVAHMGVAVPDGAEPLLMRSREWYDALATAGLIVTNIEMDPFFSRRPGQTVVQTFHGYPAKSMGMHEWRQKNFTPTMMRTQLRRTSGNWTVALTPSPEMDGYYREQYAYEGTILNRGYPRDDLLVGAETGERRRLVRQRLGLRQDQQVVLYAPTWREEEATSFRSARMSNLLDVEATAAALESHVVLVRGHRFHASSTDTAARVIDVSNYPEINDLILAADVAVLDYSSLRFDFALTGKPIIFLVPDLEDYANRGRGFLFPFTDSAPGPLLSTTEEVIEALLGLDRVHAEYASAIAEFNHRYHADQDGRSASRVVDHLIRAGAV